MLKTRRNTWWIGGLACVFAVSGVAVAIDANAQQRRPGATAKKATAKKVTPRKTTRKAAPKVTTAVARPMPPATLTIPPGANTMGAHAGLYLNFLADAQAVNVSQATSGAAISRLTEQVARHLNGDRLALGFVAYGAAHAATNDRFVEEARKAAEYYGRDAFIQKMRTEYAWARTLPGADDALATAQRALLADAAAVTAKGDTFKTAAYDLQTRPWAKVRVADAAARNLALTRLVPPLPVPAPSIVYSALPETPVAQTTTAPRALALRSANTLTTDSDRLAVTLPTATPAWYPADRILAVAALAAIGAPADKPEEVELVMRDPRLTSCINAARLNLRMCNAATRQPFERSFCLAEHPLNETAKCVSKAAR
jgi:hypothetical protein